MTEGEPRVPRERTVGRLRHSRAGGRLDRTRGLLLGVALLACSLALPTGAAGKEANPFGLALFSVQTTEASPGQPFASEPYSFRQAGGHPFALTNTVDFTAEEVGAKHTLEPTQDPKNVVIDLPPGLLANPQAVPSCSGAVTHCPADTQVGTFALRISLDETSVAILGPIVNMTPYTGVAAELGLETPIARYLLTGRVVYTAQGYALSVMARDLPRFGIVSLETTLWGVPASPTHDAQRGLTCLQFAKEPQASCSGGGAIDEEEEVAFLTMPSNCSTSGSLSAVVWVDSWEQPGQYVQARSVLPVPEDCERLAFQPQITISPETLSAEAPVGMDVSIDVPQVEGNAVAAPELRAASVTLPQGVSINPAAADGLQGCDATGPTGINLPTGLNSSGEPLEIGQAGPGEAIPTEGLGAKEPELASGHCPSASTVGTAEAITPLLDHPLGGRVFVATPECGGSGLAACTEQDAVDGSLYRLYVELGANTERDDGVLLKLMARVKVNPLTGQLTVELTELPQLPFSELVLHLFGDERALLANPTTCGAARTTSVLEPWSAPYAADAAPSSYYELTGCTETPLRPELLAGSTNARAAAPTPFTLTVTRHAGEPFLAGIQLRTPRGLSAELSGVPLCDDALASSGQCPQASRIGSSEVAAGSGTLPLYLPGTVYLTGPYDGAPFGLSIVTDAPAGPLSFGALVIRARIEVDPRTAALTITTDPFVQRVLGVPLRIQRVGLDIDRPSFIVNPTNCEEQHIVATILGSQGASANVSTGFGIGDCASLAFKPTLSAHANGRTSYTSGASLDLKLVFPKAQAGTVANLAQIAIALPRALPTRLTTLQRACPQMRFDDNPASCPRTSVVGVAKAQSPVLASPLTGPVYIVAHRRDALPSPVVVLQAEGVELDLSGATTIDKAGVAHVVFNAIPDVPIDDLELSLPQGPHSLLGASSSLCRSATASVSRRPRKPVEHRPVKATRQPQPATLAMPTELVAQNGTIVHRTTKIQVTGCRGR
jgi:hypothetical protein